MSQYPGMCPAGRLPHFIYPCSYLCSSWANAVLFSEIDRARCFILHRTCYKQTEITVRNVCVTKQLWGFHSVTASKFSIRKNSLKYHKQLIDLRDWLQSVSILGSMIFALVGCLEPVSLDDDVKGDSPCRYLGRVSGIFMSYWEFLHAVSRRFQGVERHVVVHVKCRKLLSIVARIETCRLFL